MVDEGTQYDPLDFEPDTDSKVHPEPDGNIHPDQNGVDGDSTVDDKEDDHWDQVDNTVRHMQEEQVSKIEIVIIGIIISVAGFALAFMGVQVMTAAFGLICSLFTAFVFISILCSIFNVR